MGSVEIKPGIHWVGAIDWAVRDFHGYITPNGTSPVQGMRNSPVSCAFELCPGVTPITSSMIAAPRMALPLARIALR